MNQAQFQTKVRQLFQQHEKLIGRKNSKLKNGNGIFDRYENPVVTADHTPIFWRYDLDPKTNRHLMERMGINATFNAGAIEHEGKILVLARVEGADRKSFLAVAESANGIDNFRFWDYPILMPETSDPDVNVYDVRVVRHEDGWIYGLFCTERKDPKAPAWDTSSAVAQCGLARTKDLKKWERLPDLKTKSPQQRNREYHTIKEVKNGLGPAPIKTAKGWLHLAHGVRNTAAGLRYVLYMFLCELERPQVITHRPAGYFMGPQGDERIGDVSNVVFSNGWVARKNGEVLIYYGSSDTRLHVATSTVDCLLDYALNTPEDPLRSHACVKQRYALIEKNLQLLKPKQKSGQKVSAKAARRGAR